MDTQDVQVKIHFKEKSTPPFGYCDFEEPQKKQPTTTSFVLIKSVSN